VRTRLVLVAVLALGVAAAVVGVVFALDSDGSSGTYRGSPPPEGLEMPDFSLTDEEGRAVSADALRGKAVAITFLDTQCTADCPIVAPLVAQAVEQLTTEERERVVALAITADPTGDTPESVNRFLDRLRIRGLLRYLVAPVEEMEPVWRAFAVTSSYETGIDDLHSIPVRVFAPDGIWVSTLNSGADLTSANLAHDLRAALQSS
jgi:cytochrome oxidase Cu insertion factor (SCO1/SenC/PrrC family)